ncbi:unnamed protein product [Notodromas monacha]|uniref:Uncharacterized protein n=1 Tax=Notodromas monacha TaxID=399045 RepID=A0A7R9BK83_9CRUS|nr:unnamed protein product [Notodromas monacha]CAG0915681.1 unnamed protein product [Notodromas monacha]
MPLGYSMYLLSSILLGEEPTVEDFILLVGTSVAFIAFILWCCFPVVPKEPVQNSDGESKYFQYRKADSYDERMY